MIFLYLAVLVTGIWWVVKTLGPEMTQSSSSNNGPEALPANELENQIHKLKILLIEKNKNINILQTEVKKFYVQVRDFHKIQVLYENEIKRLREQNRIFRSELGIPTLQIKENSVK